MLGTMLWTDLAMGNLSICRKRLKTFLQMFNTIWYFCMFDQSLANYLHCLATIANYLHLALFISLSLLIHIIIGSQHHLRLTNNLLG